MKDCLSESLYNILKENHLTISTMESCTAGLLCSNLTDRCGASDVIYGGRIVYNNEQKILAGVSRDILHQYGVYSRECAIDMAETIRIRLGSSIGIGVTGTFGNLDKNNSDGEIGKVYFAIVNDSRGFDSKLVVPVEYIGDRKISKQFVVDKILSVLPEFIKKSLGDK